MKLSVMGRGLLAGWLVVAAMGCGGGGGKPDAAASGGKTGAGSGGAAAETGGRAGGGTGGTNAAGSGGMTPPATGGSAGDTGGAPGTGGATGGGGGAGGRGEMGSGNGGSASGGRGGNGGGAPSGGAGGAGGRGGATTTSTGGSSGAGGAGGRGGANTGGANTGGANTGGANTGGAGGTGGASTCPAVAVGPAGPHAARSAGYAGTLTDYSNLYNTPCTTLQDCATACTNVGGTTDSCTMGSECVNGAVPGGSMHCLPPTYWRYETGALEESADWTGAAEQTVVVIAYQDPLQVTDFRLSVPAGSTIRGIQFEVRRSGEQSVDDSIRVLRNGVAVGTDQKKAGAWGSTLAYVTYGGPTELWGTTWTPADVQNAGFGIAIADRYTATAGNDRAYVDYVKATVFYSPPTCP